MEPNPYDRIIWSADVDDISSIIALLDKMPELQWIKIDQVFLINNEDGWDIFPILRERGLKIFVDAKANEVDQKLELMARGYVRRAQPDMLNCMAGAVSIDSTKETDALRRFAKACGENVLPCGVSLLTTKSPELVAEEFNGRTVIDQVEWYAHQLLDAGITHIVCSPLEASVLKKWTTLAGLTLVTPGIRPEGSAVGTQSRYATPSEAIRLGSDYLVIGGPITDAADPSAALAAIAAEIASVL